MFEITIKADIHIHASEQTKLEQILHKLEELNTKMSKADDAITELNTAFQAFKTGMSTALDNIVQDEKNILAQLNTLGDLSPESKAIVEGIKTDMTAMVAREQATADSIPDVPAPPTV